MKIPLLFTVSVFASLAATHQSEAATVLVNYPFTTSAASTDSDPNSTASNMFFNTNTLGGTPFISGSDVVQLTYNVTTNRDTTAPATGPLGENIALSEAASVNDGSYVAFTITPNTNFVLNLSELKFDIRIAAGGGSNGIRFFVRSDAGSDNFATTLGSGDNLGTTFETKTVDLSGNAFQNVTTPVSFRLYYYDRGSTSPNPLARWELDNVVLIPEPASMSLLGLGGLLLLMRRRRK